MYSDRYALKNGLPTVRQNNARACMPQTMSAKEAAAIIGVHPSTVRRWRRTGRLGVRLEPGPLLKFIRRTSAA